MVFGDFIVSHWLIKEAEEPERYLVVAAHLRVISCVDGVARVSHFACGSGVAHSVFLLSVDEVELVFGAFMDVLGFCVIILNETVTIYLTEK